MNSHSKMSRLKMPCVKFKNNIKNNNHNRKNISVKFQS